MTIAPHLDTSLRLAKIIRPAGGTIETTSGTGVVYSLSLPAGAVLKDTEIAITPVSDIPNLPFVAQILGGVQFEPDGLLLTKPAIFTLDLPPGTDPAKVIGFSWQGTGENVHLELVTQTGNQLTFLVSHFSGDSCNRNEPDLQPGRAIQKPDACRAKRHPRQNLHGS